MAKQQYFLWESDTFPWKEVENALRDFFHKGDSNNKERLRKGRLLASAPKAVSTTGNKSEEKIRHTLQLLLLFLCLLFLSSCGTYLPQSQEMGNMALLRSFAVDRGENWKVTVSTGKQMKGMTAQDPVILRGEAATFQGACGQINQYTEDFVFYGYIDQVILGEDYARTGIEKVLQYFATQESLSLGTGIWLSLGEAGSILDATQEQGASEHLSTLKEESQLAVGGMTKKVGEVFAELRSQSATYLPVLTTSEESGLIEVGYGILKEDVLVEIYQGDLAKGLELLESHPQIYELLLEEGGYAVALEEIKVKYSPTWGEKGELTGLSLRLQVQGELLETPLPPREDYLSPLEEALSQLARNTLASLQENEADVLGLGGKVAMTSPSHAYDLDWGTSFPSLAVEISVSVELI